MTSPLNPAEEAAFELIFEERTCIVDEDRKCPETSRYDCVRADDCPYIGFFRRMNERLEGR